MADVKFDHYFSFEEMESFLKDAAARHPDLCDLSSVGKSGEGRDIWVMTLSHTSAGLPEEKPAIYIDGNFHAGEVTGSMINLYAIDYILENYGKDPKVTDLLRRSTVYFIPRVSPDGAEVYLTTPETLRSAPRPYPFPDPEKREGLHASDIDGDGHILTMRIKDPAGEWKVSPKDPRAFIRRSPDEHEGTFYRVYTEGFLKKDDDGDENSLVIKSAPSKWGLDFNRNFPYGWVPEVEQSGAGAFPLSEPETKAVARFIVKHPNISLGLTYHTTGGVILRVPGAHSHTKSPRHDIDAMAAIGEMGAQETGYPCVPCYEEFYGGGDRFSRGAFDDWLLEHQGILSYTVETWNLAQRAGIHQFPRKEKSIKEQEEDYLKMLTWNDRELAGKGFENWRPFDHPQLGQVEIGGWYVKYVIQNAPLAFLEAECHKNAMFIVRAAAALPRLEICRLRQRTLGPRVYEVSAWVKNTGFLPSFGSETAQRLKKAGPLTAELGLAKEGRPLEDGFEIVGKAKKEIGYLHGRSESTGAFSHWSARTPAIDRAVKAAWVVRAQKGTEVRVNIKGDRAGSVIGTLVLE